MVSSAEEVKYSSKIVLTTPKRESTRGRQGTQENRRDWAKQSLLQRLGKRGGAIPEVTVTGQDKTIIDNSQAQVPDDELKQIFGSIQSKWFFTVAYKAIRVPAAEAVEERKAPLDGSAALTQLSKYQRLGTPEDIEGRLGTSDATIQRLGEEKSTLERQVTDLEEKVDATESEALGYLGRAEQAEGTVNTLTTEREELLARYDKDVAKLRTTHAAELEAVQERLATVGTLEEALRTAEKSLEEATETVDARDQRIVTLGEEARAAKDRYKKEKERLSGELEGVRTRAIKYWNRILADDKTLQKFRVEISKRGLEVEELERVVNAKKKQIQRLEGQLGDEDAERLQRELRDKEDEVGRLQGQIKSDAVTTKGVTADLATAKSDLEAARAEYATAQGDLTAKADEIGQLKKGISLAREAGQRYEKDLTSLRDEVAALEKGRQGLVRAIETERAAKLNIARTASEARNESERFRRDAEAKRGRDLSTHELLALYVQRMFGEGFTKAAEAYTTEFPDGIDESTRAVASEDKFSFILAQSNIKQRCRELGLDTSESLEALMAAAEERRSPFEESTYHAETRFAYLGASTIVNLGKSGDLPEDLKDSLQGAQQVVADFDEQEEQWGKTRRDVGKLCEAIGDTGDLYDLAREDLVAVVERQPLEATIPIAVHTIEGDETRNVYVIFPTNDTTSRAELARVLWSEATQALHDFSKTGPDLGVEVSNVRGARMLEVTTPKTGEGAASTYDIVHAIAARHGKSVLHQVGLTLDLQNMGSEVYKGAGEQ